MAWLAGALPSGPVLPPHATTSENMHIKDKVIVITGASSGIGEATALLLAARGAKLVLGARRPEKLEAVARLITDAGGQVACASIDVKHRADLARLVALGCERFGRVDALVSNAGIGPISLFDDLRVDDWDEMIDINIKGVLNGVAAALPLFRSQGFGHFINICSTAAHRIVPTMGVYAATKTAVRVISEGLRQEAGDKLRVTVVSPGMTRTNFSDSITDAGTKARTDESMDKLAIAPDAIARAIAFAIEQPADVDIGEIIVRPTAQA